MRFDCVGFSVPTEGVECHPVAQIIEYQSPRRLGGGRWAPLLVQDVPEAQREAHDASGPGWILCSHH